MRCRILILFFGVAVGFVLKAESVQAAGDIPRGVFSSGRAGQPTDPRVLANPAVDGISIREQWQELEPSKGVYDWSFLDEETARAEKAGKKLLVRILSEGQSTPPWVLNEGVRVYPFESRNPWGQAVGKFAIFWDPNYLAEKKAMIEAVGAHLSGNAAVQVVAAICASARTGDWWIPHTPADVEHWHAVGYTTEKMIDVCKQIIDVTMRSFPRQFVTLAVGRNGTLDPDPDYVARATIEYAHSRYPGRLIVQKTENDSSPIENDGCKAIDSQIWSFFDSESLE